jgi:copper homeostasis protein
MMRKIHVEICCGSADDVFVAAEAGADRAELNSCLFLGGLTPSIGEMMTARGASIKIMAMVRPREGGFCYTDREFETMLADAAELIKAGADGIVFGILNPDGTVDVKRCQAMMRVIGGKESVFHRAIDVVPDWRAALDALIGLGINRVLTSGQAPSVHYGAETVRKMTEHAAGRIEILPGAGIKAYNALDIVEKTGAGWIHFSMNKTVADSSAAGNPSISFGGALYPPEDRFKMADGGGIGNMIKLVNES